MSNLSLIVDAHDLVNLHLERLNLLLLLLPGQQGMLSESQECLVNQWMTDIVDEALDSVRAASDALSNLKEDAA